LLDDPAARTEQMAAADEVAGRLRADDEPASISAGRAVLKALGQPN
jgi:hypothetical protein